MMKKTRIEWIGLASLFIVVSVWAVGCDTGLDLSGLLEGADKASIMTQYPAADLDADGALSDEEVQAFRDSRRGSEGMQMPMMDGGPGMMGEERLSMVLEQYPEADLDGDGTLTQDEARAFRMQMMLERHPEADLDGDGTLSEEETQAFRDSYRGSEAMQAERLAMILERHPEADLDGDGTLSQEEARAFMGSRHGRSRCGGGPG